MASVPIDTQVGVHGLGSITEGRGIYFRRRYGPWLLGRVVKIAASSAAGDPQRRGVLSVPAPARRLTSVAGSQLEDSP
jgi:hypothetical protein